MSEEWLAGSASLYGRERVELDLDVVVALDGILEVEDVRQEGFDAKVGVRPIELSRAYCSYSAC